MYRNGSPALEHRAAMRVDLPAAVELVLRAAKRERREFAANAVAGRTVHADAVLRESPHDSVAAKARLERQPQTCATTHAADGHRSDLREAAIVRSSARTSDLSISAERNEDHAAESGVEHRHHLYSSEWRFRISGGDSGLVQPVRAGVGNLDHTRHELLRVGTGLGVEEVNAGDLQHRSGGAVYERRVHEPTGEGRHPDQHGWTWTRAGQRFHGAIVANCEVRRSLLERLRWGVRRDWKLKSLFSLLQLRTASSVVGISNARIRAFFAGLKSLWKLPLLWKSAKNADFTQAACKSLAKNARLSHSSHRLGGDENYEEEFRRKYGQRSTLNGPILCPTIGVHPRCNYTVLNIVTFATDVNYVAVMTV